MKRFIASLAVAAATILPMLASVVPNAQALCAKTPSGIAAYTIDTVDGNGSPVTLVFNKTAQGGFCSVLDFDQRFGM